MAETKIFGITIPKSKKKSQKEADVPEFTSETLKDFRPKTPLVNLLPESVFEEYAVQDLKKKFASIAAVLILLLALGYFATIFLQQQVEDDLRGLEQETALLNSELASLSVYQNYVNEVDQKRQTLFDQFNEAIEYTAIARQISQSAQENGVSVSDFSFGSGDAAGACSSPDPFNPSPAVGCITLTGTADSITDVEEFTNSLASQTGFVYPYFPSVTVGEDSVNLVGSVGYTNDLGSVTHPDMAMSIVQQLAPAAAENNQEQPPLPDATTEDAEIGGE